MSFKLENNGLTKKADAKESKYKIGTTPRQLKQQSTTIELKSTTRFTKKKKSTTKLDHERLMNHGGIEKTKTDLWNIGCKAI